MRSKLIWQFQLDLIVTVIQRYNMKILLLTLELPVIPKERKTFESYQTTYHILTIIINQCKINIYFWTNFIYNTSLYPEQMNKAYKTITSVFGIYMYISHHVGNSIITSGLTVDSKLHLLFYFITVYIWNKI